MNQKFIITTLSYNEKEYLVYSLLEENQMVQLYLMAKDSKEMLGNIYVGRVKDIVKNLNAAFVEISPGVPCYLPLEDLKNPIYVKKIHQTKLVQGEELLVQVEKESIKTKPPKVTTNLSFIGKYLVVTTGIQTVGVSGKIEKQKRLQLKELLEKQKDSPLGIIVRTNSQNAESSQILEEYKLIQKEAMELLEKAPYQTCFSCMRKPKPEYLRMLQSISSIECTEIITDDSEIYQELETNRELFDPEKTSQIRFYQDNLLPLHKCYSIETKLKEALKEKVWLKSGGYLLIQPTEAMTVIDVNSGKSISKKSVQEHYLKVNLEAAEEIAVQLRLRNISGIIIVDFIDMKDAVFGKQLLETLKKYTAKDSVPVQVLGLTKLNLVEMTRKKVKKSLKEQVDFGLTL